MAIAISLKRREWASIVNELELSIGRGGAEELQEIINQIRVAMAPKKSKKTKALERGAQLALKALEGLLKKPDGDGGNGVDPEVRGYAAEAIEALQHGLSRKGKSREA